MIQTTVQMRILVAVEAVDFRNGIDGLARVCKQQLQADPFSGGLFVFRNRRRTAIKILAYDGQGFWLCQNQQSSHYDRQLVVQHIDRYYDSHGSDLRLLGGFSCPKHEQQQCCGLHRDFSAFVEPVDGPRHRYGGNRRKCYLLERIVYC
jgi:hypothetical protein